MWAWRWWWMSLEVFLGLVTLEDVLEQMVGEIHDEFDVVERPLTLGGRRGGIRCGAECSRPWKRNTTITIPEDPAYATVGGFVLDQLGFIPKGGESFDFGNSRFTCGGDGRQNALRG